MVLFDSLTRLPDKVQDHYTLLNSFVIKSGKGGNFPVAYPYPAEWRATRDLLRRRMYISPAALNWSPTSKTPTVSIIGRHLVKIDSQIQP
jgi:hypothetical protein